MNSTLSSSISSSGTPFPTEEMKDCVMELMPCSYSITGNLFLIAVLGTILAFSAKTIADGSDLLLEVLHPGVIGGFVIPLLGALPDALIILVSGIGDADVVKEEISVGMGTLCGSTIMLLTIAWSGGLFAGRTDIVKGKSVDKQLNRKWNILRTGVTTIKDIRWNAVIMVVTLLPYFIILIVSLVDYPQVIDPVEKEDLEDEYIMASFVITCIFFVAYSIYMVFNTTVQENRMRAARRRLVMDMVAQLFVQSIRESHQMDDIIDGMEGVMPGPTAHRFQLQEDDALTKSLLQAASNPEDDDSVNIALITDQMVNGGNFNDLYSLARRWKRWAQNRVTVSMHAKEQAEAAAAGIEDEEEAKKKIAAEYENNMASLKNMGGDAATLALEQGEGEKEKGEGEEGEEEEGSGKQGKVKIIIKACILLVLGAGGAAIFSDPMVDNIKRFSDVAGIHPFFVSFIVTPFASNASELIASLYFCAKKTSQSVSVAMAAVYGAVTMNSTLNLGILLLLMWRQDIYWAFTAEAIPMILSVFVVGIVASVKSTFTTLEGLLVLSLYPLSIGCTYLLQLAGLDTPTFPTSSSSTSS